MHKTYFLPLTFSWMFGILLQDLMDKLMNNPFKTYLEKRSESALGFSKRSGISVVTVYRIFHGGKPRKDIAKKIVRHSNKELSLKDFGYE